MAIAINEDDRSTQIARGMPVKLGLLLEPFETEAHNKAYWSLCEALYKLRSGKELGGFLARQLPHSLPLLRAEWPDLPAEVPSPATAAVWLGTVERQQRQMDIRHPTLAYLREVAVLADATLADRAQAKKTWRAVEGVREGFVPPPPRSRGHGGKHPRSPVGDRRWCWHIGGVGDSGALAA